MMDSEDSDR